MTDEHAQHTSGTRLLRARLDDDARTLLSARPVEEWRDVMRAIDDAGRRAGDIAWSDWPVHRGFEFRQWSDGAGAVAGWFFAPDGQVLVSVFDHECDLNLFAEYSDDYGVQDLMYDGLPDLWRRLVNTPPVDSDLTTDAHPQGGLRLWSSGVFVHDGDAWSAAPSLAACLAEAPGLFRTDHEDVLVNGRGQPVGLDETGLPLILEAICAEYDRLMAADSSPGEPDRRPVREDTSGKPTRDNLVISIAEQMVDLPWPDSEDPDEHPTWRIEGIRGRTAYGIAHQMRLGAAVRRRQKSLSASMLTAFDERFGSHQVFDMDAYPEYDPTAEVLDMRVMLALILRDTGATRALWWQPTPRRLVVAGIGDDPGGVMARLTKRPPSDAELITGLVVIPPEMLEEPGGATPESAHGFSGMDLVDIAAFAMFHPWSDEEREAFRSQPYPLPAGLTPAIDALERALPADHERRLQDLLAQAAERYVPSSAFTGTIGLDRGSATMHRTGLPAVVLHLISHGILRDSEVEFLIASTERSDLPETDRDLVIRDLLLHVLEVYLVRDSTAPAEQTAQRISDLTPGTAHLGWREIVAYHAANGNATAFLALWSRCEEARDPDGLQRLKERLVRSVAVREGWRAAIELCDDRRFGDAFRRHAFAPPAYGHDDLVTLFSGEAAGVLDEPDELHALVAARQAGAIPTHVHASNSRRKQSLRDDGRAPDQIRAALHQLDGASFWAYSLWRTPADADLSDELPDSEEYLQCAGTADALTIEWRRLDADGVAHQYTLGRSGHHQHAPATEHISWGDGRTGTDVRPHEVFTADEAARVFSFYFLTDTVPESYRLTPIRLCCTQHGHPEGEDARPLPAGRALEFADRSCKIAVMQELMDQGLLPRFTWADYAATQQIELDESDLTVFGTAIPEAMAYVDAVAITLELAEHVTSIEMEAGNDLYTELSLHWDGEDDLFDVRSLADLRHFPRLRSVELLYDLHDPGRTLLEEIAAARERGLEVRHVYE